MRVDLVASTMSDFVIDEACSSWKGEKLRRLQAVLIWRNRFLLL